MSIKYHAFCFTLYADLRKKIDPTIGCRPPGWLFIPIRMRNSSQKKSHKFRRLLLGSILYFDFVEFSENRDKEFQLGSMLFQNC